MKMVQEKLPKIEKIDKFFNIRTSQCTYNERVNAHMSSHICFFSFTLYSTVNCLTENSLKRNTHPAMLAQMHSSRVVCGIQDRLA